MKFGNWIVTDEKITWFGSNQQFEIPVNQLNEIRPAIADQQYYEWILAATDQHWLTQNDLYDLNYAFVFAIAKSGLDFNYEIFDATLEVQFDQFDDEDNEEDDLNYE